MCQVSCLSDHRQIVIELRVENRSVDILIIHGTLDRGHIQIAFKLPFTSLGYNWKYTWLEVGREEVDGYHCGLSSLKLSSYKAMLNGGLNHFLIKKRQITKQFYEVRRYSRWEVYKWALTEYTIALQRARLRRVLDHKILGIILGPNNTEYIQFGKETVEILHRVHFPDSVVRNLYREW